MVNKKVAERGHRIYIYLILTSLCFLVYANSLNNNFLVIDDIPAILENPQIFHPLSFWADPSSLLNSFSYKIAKFNVIPYHLVNIILHSLVTILVFHFLCLFFKREPSFLSAALFAVHPIHTEAVTWISGRPYIILTFFTLLTYLLYYRATNQDNDVDKKFQHLNYALSLGIFSYFIIKNYSFYFLFPFFIILSDVLFKQWRKNYKLWIPFLTLTILRVILARGIIHERVISTQIYIAGRIEAWRNPIPPFIYSIFSYLRLLFWPVRLTFYHEPIVYPLTMWVGFIALIIFTCFLPYIFKKAKSIFLGIGMFVLFLAPTYSPLPVAWLVAERYVYLPSIFLSMLAAFFFEKYFRTTDKKRILGIALFIFLIAAYGVRTISRNRDWKDNSRFCRVNLYISPNSPLAHNNMGVAYLEEGNIYKAIEEFNTVIKLKPNFTDAYYNRGKAYQDQGNLNQAIADYNQALKLNPNYAQAYYNRALVYFLRQEYSKSWEDIHKAETLGYSVSPEFLKELRKVSGRER